MIIHTIVINHKECCCGNLPWFNLIKNTLPLHRKGFERIDCSYYHFNQQEYQDKDAKWWAFFVLKYASQFLMIQTVTVMFIITEKQNYYSSSIRWQLAHTAQVIEKTSVFPASNNSFDQRFWKQQVISIWKLKDIYYWTEERCHESALSFSVITYKWTIMSYQDFERDLPLL